MKKIIISLSIIIFCSAGFISVQGVSNGVPNTTISVQRPKSPPKPKKPRKPPKVKEPSKPKEPKKPREPHPRKSPPKPPWVK